MTLKQTLSRHPLLGLCLCLMVLLGLTGAMLTLHFAAQQQATSASQYGNALAESAASQAVEPALSQDMISLQVILQAVAQQPNVSGATIHDVENQLLVQSGSGNAPPHYSELNFTAPITLDTHIAGHLGVTLALPPIQQVYDSFIWAWALTVFIAMLVCVLAYRRLSQQQGAGKEPAHDLEQTAADSQGVEDEPSEQEIAGAESTDSHCVTVKLQLLNINKLEQQLSLNNYQSCLKKFDRLVKGILALYEGEKNTLENGRLTLSVTSDNLDDASFYGICIGHLACELSQQQPSPRLKISVTVTTPDGSSQRTPEQTQLPDAGTIWVDPALHSPALASHVSITERQQVAVIKPPYQALLERQCKQLQAALHQDAE
ncbi:hypothetical protein QWI17_13265 [Gilvimarinus sp. SDUM040013]|uniref:Uncharacterized protein n=1 Tax=Gilvimarinus gilvus TaxID=3058038 RepID=A0ABU4RTP2_9GAMM|nr:hypothetical protein [Gilvimarinus sp. SDUM040013]MDO3386810.1 hypothetical protein [Gilvimarinus sp. SDUM040013]MDX6848260.1 hypothetical protein [Gilvimarinus sp. SDUM040013]